MAAAADVRVEVTCTVCLNIYTEPVTLPCGHNFCLSCIGKTWDWQEGIEEQPSCPECRERFRTRPELKKNSRLRNIAEHFRSEQPKQNKTDIYCTYCDASVPAAKYCVRCEASLCDSHVQLHSSAEEHVLVEPTASLAKRKCAVHNRLLEYHCREDGASICASCCLVGAHRGHNVEQLSEASEKEKKKLKKVLEYLIPAKEVTEKSLLKLKDSRDKVQKRAAAESEHVSALFRTIREWLESLEMQMLEEISRQEELLSLPFSDMIQELEAQKEQLSEKIHQIEELCNMADPLSVLQSRESDGDGEEEDDYDGRVMRYRPMPRVRDLDQDLISQTLHTGLNDIVKGAKRMWKFGQRVKDLEMDINTAGPAVALSENRKFATDCRGDQDHPQSPERFEHNQVVSTTGFSSGRHYWDVEGSESGKWCVGVAYPSMEKGGDSSMIGFNDKSWGLFQIDKTLLLGLIRGPNHYTVLHNNIEYILPDNSACTRIRVSLDYKAGRLSFYELSDPIKHLHTYTASFTEPLHAAFWVESSWVKIIS
ncbi:E3 ubiquitin-protein ligase TRIM7 [Xenopus tropicalis]|uniref:E3 ubiquitin-protein ligase TRIM7 n=1 Tax=Xenopus tropicalis TaxID=8364 RepID=A0A803J571_XENTR|nr:E3 ubiquitin-protein ligase TRIM7 [Xenopus tropicalis]|eukprot:XP_002941273.1 PREDICTED: tripartite motif-containing protein 7-like [Xenopus tropicalis]